MRSPPPQPMFNFVKRSSKHRCIGLPDSERSSTDVDNEQAQRQLGEAFHRFGNPAFDCENAAVALNAFIRNRAITTVRCRPCQQALN